MTTQRKLTPGPLLDRAGRLIQRGYATALMCEYMPERVRLRGLRLKEWDYYLISNQSFGVALTIADQGYVGLVSATALDFTRPAERTRSFLRPLPLGGTNFPTSSREGDVAVRGAKYEIAFMKYATRRQLSCHIEDFYGGKPLEVELELDDEPPESMVIATPFAGKPEAFYYNQKILGMRAQGFVRLGEEKCAFDPAETCGLLDWGRGVWTYDNTWYWSAAQGVVDGCAFAFNLGYGFGDTSAATENMLFADGEAHKLDQVAFHIPVDGQGHCDYLRKWHFSSSDGRFEAEFTPIIDRASRTSLGVIMSDQHQVFGHFDGKAILDDSRVVTFRHFLGFAEKVRNKW